MKLLSSSPSSSLSSSTTLNTFDPTFQTSTPGGCITTILHRILCSGGLPTHPSDQIRELYSNSIETSTKVQKFKTNVSSSSSSPGVVARLMGLDSMAEVPNSPLSRSRSLNSMDYLGECKEGEDDRVVKSSASFRDVPGFKLLENENFLVFSFENGGGESKKLKSRRRKERNKREKVHEEKGYYGNCETVKKRKKRETCCVEKKEESECSSEDSSPVSVFDFEREAPEKEVDVLGVDMSWRRKLSAELENKQLFNLHSNSNIIDHDERKVESNEKKVEAKKKEKKKRVQEYVDIWGEICRLVEDELVGTNEVKRKEGDFESISEDFEYEIFNQLLDEVIDELVGMAIL